MPWPLPRACSPLAQNTDDPLVQEERQELIDQWSGVPAQAYRMAGQDYLDVGDVQMAIVCLRISDVIDPENYDGPASAGQRL